MPKKAGIGDAINKRKQQEKYKDKGTEIQDNQMEEMTRQLEVFRKKLEEFSSRYKNEIRRNPKFRQQFQEMCAAIGVDPLASSKGFWSELLGVGEFYYELAVQIVEVCMATSHDNGGLIDLDELRTRLKAAGGRRRQTHDISNDDLLRAIKKLRVLGKGFQVIQTGPRYMVQSVPRELSMDHTQLLEMAERSGNGRLMPSQVRSSLRWTEERMQKAINDLLKEGLVWLDADGAHDETYWFPALFPV